MITTIDQKIAELANNWVIDGWPIGNLCMVLAAIILSVILCGLIGIEREWRGRSAGLRTHLLVGVGSCVIMIISIYGFPALSGNRDVARLAAQIITGVGFLGAGAIMHRSGGVKGLTTAGTIWAVMAIGIACGSFNFIIAVLASSVIFFVLTFFKKVENKLGNRNPVIILTAPRGEATLDKILVTSKKHNCTIHGLSTELSEDCGAQTITCTFQAEFDNASQNVESYLADLEKETNAVSISLLNRK